VLKSRLCCEFIRSWYSVHDLVTCVEMNVLICPRGNVVRIPFSLLRGLVASTDAHRLFLSLMLCGSCQLSMCVLVILADDLHLSLDGLSPAEWSDYLMERSPRFKSQRSVLFLRSRSASRSSATTQRSEWPPMLLRLKGRHALFPLAQDQLSWRERSKSGKNL
jgi:hypothetical protein